MAPAADETSKPSVASKAAEQLDAMIDKMTGSKTTSSAEKSEPVAQPEEEASRAPHGNSIDEDENGVYSVESLCMNCHDNVSGCFIFLPA